MNGRLYDPLVGRFLSADPYVQADGQTQAYNRYSYCLNNPLRYIDPSGYRTVLGRFFHWVGENAGTIGTVAYLAGAAVTTVFCPPAGLAMFGAYLGGAQANNWELNAGSWNRSDPMTYMGIGIGALTGYVSGYGLVHPGTVALRFGPSIAGVGEIGLSISNNNWQLSWTTSAGGGGNYNLNGRNTSAEQIGERAVADARATGDGGANWLNPTNTVNTWTGAAALVTNKVLTGTRLGSNIGYSLAYKGIGNATKYITPIGYGTTGVGIITGSISFVMSDQSWGDYGQLGISLLSSGLTLSGYTAPIGIGIGVIDVAGGFNGFYQGLDAEQQFYNNTGGVMIPVNGFPTFIPIRRP